MKKFVIHVIKYVALPIILIFISIELILLYYPNTFSKKAQYLNKNIENIEILFTGSSHTEDGINPMYINKTTLNLGYSAQPPKIDSALIYKYIHKLPNLKYIIHESDYIHFFKNTDSTYFRYPWYEKYYDIKVGSYPPYKKWSLYLSNPDFFNSYLTREIWSGQNINQFGYNDIERKLSFFKANYDSITIYEDNFSAADKFPLTPDNLTIFRQSIARVKQLKKISSKYNVDYIRILYPMHKTYIKQVEGLKSYKLWRRYIEEEKKKGEVIWDFERDSNFYIRDFSNSSHLSNQGAKKLSKMLNDSINVLYRNN